MKQILGNLCRASVAAAGVMVATSAASAESKPLQFETEFDLDLLPADVSLEATATAAALDIVPAVAGWQDSIGAYLDNLLDAEPAPAPAPAPTTQAIPADAGTAAVVEVEIEAFTATEVAAPAAPTPEVKPLPPELLEVLGIDPAEAGEEPADVLIPVAARAEVKAEVKTDAEAQAKAEPAVNPLLLAPVLSHPMDCELCHARVEESPQQAGQAAAPANVDDAAAWQALADWAAARAAEQPAADDSDPADAVTAESDFFFDIDVDDASPTE